MNGHSGLHRSAQSIHVKGPPCPQSCLARSAPSPIPPNYNAAPSTRPLPPTTSTGTGPVTTTPRCSDRMAGNNASPTTPRHVVRRSTPRPCTPRSPRSSGSCSARRTSLRAPASSPRSSVRSRRGFASVWSRRRRPPTSALFSAPLRARSIPPPSISSWTARPWRHPSRRRRATHTHSIRSASRPLRQWRSRTTWAG